MTLATTPLRVTYTAAEVSRLTGLTEPTVRGLIARQLLPCVRLGRRVLVPVKDLETFLATRR
jgi:excisionase family DNA binding protein